MARQRSHRFDDKKIWWLRFVKSLLLFFAAVLLVFTLILGVSSVSGHSMDPTLYDGQPVLFFRLHKKYETGDVISVRMSNGEKYVKRVVAVAGDTVDIQNGVLYINGEPEQSAFAHGATERQTYELYPLTLHEGQIFVLGDNREVSVDSRTFGPLSTSQTRGKVLFTEG